MIKYKVMKSYKKSDNTLMKGDEEFVEYPVVLITFETLHDARKHLEFVAMKEGMTIFNRSLNAEKESVTIDEENDVITTETERLSIVVVA